MGLSPAMGAESLLLPSMLTPCFPVPSQLGPLHGQWAGAGKRPWGREGTGLVVTCCEGVLPRGCSSGDHVVPRHPSAALATPDLLSLLWIPLELLPGPRAVARVLGCAQGLLQGTGATGWLAPERCRAAKVRGLAGKGGWDKRSEDPSLQGSSDPVLCSPTSIPTMLSVHCEQLNKTGFPTVHAVVLLEGTMNLTGETQPLVEQLMMVKRMQVQK